MKKIILTGIAALSMCTGVNAAYLWNWSHKTGSNSGDRGKCVSNPVNLSIASSGFFQGTVDFDPGPGTLNLVSAVSPSPSDMYVANYNTTGTLLWADPVRDVALAVFGNRTTIHLWPFAPARWARLSNSLIAALDE